MAFGLDRNRARYETKVAHRLNVTSGSAKFLLAVVVSLSLAAPVRAQRRRCPVSDLTSCVKRKELPADIDSPPDVTFWPHEELTRHAAFTDLISEARGPAPSESTRDTSIGCLDSALSSTSPSISVADGREKSANADKPGEGSSTSVVSVRPPKPMSSNEFFYKNKLEFSLEGGWLPVNIPFVFDVFLGDGYTMTNLKYTLVPMIASVRWQTGNPDGPWIFRGNWDLEASGAAVVIPRGPETRYFAFILGFRRNFVPRSGRIAPYFDGRLGMGAINAKEPLGVLYAQGQNFTFTMNMGSGIRYNINPRYAFWAGLNWMHISNLYLSQPQFANYGINVYGPMFGVDVRLSKPRRHGSE